ncbi:MAG: FAD-binding oxidoreductase, partial [bacterium]
YNFTIITDRGKMKAEKILFATGAWSAKLLKNCGIDFPIEPYRRSLYISEPLPWYPKNSPFTFDVNTGVHLRPESGGVLFLEINPDEKPSFNEEADWEWLVEIIPHLIHFIPRMADAGVIDAWAGLYDMSPDHSAILGALPGPKGRFVATGFSGHGLMHAPAVGCSMAELLSDGKTWTIDISKFRPGRFDENEPILEKAVF